ncbi:Cpr-5 [Aphelenchoides bicaudatus]|nr:Cpr-5 [Aphelenchoides bicaudatus]
MHTLCLLALLFTVYLTTNASIVVKKYSDDLTETTTSKLASSSSTQKPQTLTTQQAKNATLTTQSVQQAKNSTTKTSVKTTSTTLKTSVKTTPTTSKTSVKTTPTTSKTSVKATSTTLKTSVKASPTTLKTSVKTTPKLTSTPRETSTLKASVKASPTTSKTSVKATSSSTSTTPKVTSTPKASSKPSSTTPVPVEEVTEDMNDDRPPMGAPMVDFINGRARKFQARRYSRFENLSKEQLQSFLGAKEDPEIVKAQLKLDRIKRSTNSTVTTNITLPTSFDISQKWPKCKKVFGAIADQSQCGSCWAVSTASVITDRRCIVYNGTKTLPRISSWDLVSCCKTCTGKDPSGCNGGWPTSAFQYYMKSGLVTGGFYKKGGCKPYPISPTAKTQPNATTCSQTCQPKYKVSNYTMDLKRGSAYKIYSKQNDAVMAEIMERGSVVAVYDVYEDFYQYSTGVYQHITGAYSGGHAVRIVGWGVEPDGTKWWRAANSWGTTWGESGYFRIIRGTNNCRFEAGIVAGNALRD